MGDAAALSVLLTCCPPARGRGWALRRRRWRPTIRVEAVPGFRFDGYQAQGRTTWAPQPRFSTKVRVLPRACLISALGVAHQEPTEQVFVPAKVPDPIVSESGGDSFKFSEAVEVRLPSSMRVRATGFYWKLG